MNLLNNYAHYFNNYGKGVLKKPKNNIIIQ
jgi:hypothetical protein